MGEVIQFAPKRPLWVDIVILVVAALVFVTMIALGNWQIDRLSWKLDLIDTVEERAFAAPSPAPQGPTNADDHQYLRVQVSGTFRHGLSKHVKAVTKLGPGHWVMTPLEGEGGGFFWINRGFIPAGLDEELIERPDGTVDVVGLVRITEPDGTLLERNKPHANRWYSRDVDALSTAAALPASADFFVDAEHALEPSAWPRGGLTILTFKNPHLSYALTWYAMAALFLAAMGYVVWDRLRLPVRRSQARRGEESEAPPT